MKQTSPGNKIVSLLTGASMFLGTVGAIPTTLAADAYCGNFYDISASSALCSAASYVRDRAIFEGYNSGYFYPEKNINRAEVLKVVLVGFLDQTFDTANPPDGEQLGFNDIAKGTKDWWYVHLKKAKDLGVVQGYADGSFRATSNVTRAEFFKMFMNLSPYKNDVVSNTFVNDWADVPSYAWYERYMAFASHYGLFNNFNYCGSTNACPEMPITRGEVAQLMMNYKNVFGKDVGFPKVGWTTRLYAGANDSVFYLSNLPSNAMGAFKVPGRVFDANESAKAIKNVDCSQATTSFYNAIDNNYNTTTADWIYFYSPASNWKDPNAVVDFYFTSSVKQGAGVYGPYHDSLQKLLEDIINSRCINGTFSGANYNGIPAAPTSPNNPTGNLSIPSLSVPANNTSYDNSISRTVNFSWSGSGAAYYMFYLREANATNPLLSTQLTGTSYNYTFSSGLNTNYFWKVRAYDNAGNWKESAENRMSFGTATQGEVGMPVLTAPASSSTLFDRDVVFTWTGSNTAYYEVKVRHSSSSNYFVNEKVTNNTSLNYKINMPVNSTATYYWRVRAYDSAGNWKESAEKSFNFDMQLTPTLASPTNNQVFNSGNQDITFIWSKPAAAVKYDLMVKFGSNSQYSIYNVATGSTTQYTVPESAFPEFISNAGYVHHWKVRAYDSDGNAIDSSENAFTVKPLLLQ